MDHIQLKDRLQQIANSKLSINLINVYKGFPIAYPAVITDITEDAIEVKTEAFQVVCLHNDRVTHIQSSDDLPLIKARVDQVDFVKISARLVDFEFVKGNIGKRKQIRVAPADLVPGVLHRSGEGKNFIGELADISLDGVGLYLAKEDNISGMFLNGTKVVMFLKLPIKNTIVPSQAETYSEYTSPQVRFDDIRTRADTPRRLEDAPPIWGTGADNQRKSSLGFKIEGVIVNMREEENTNRYRFGIRILPGDPTKAVISKFLVQRQSELIREVRSLYDMLVRAASDEAERKTK